MRIAVLGLGFMGSTHLKAWRSVLGAQVTAVYSNDERKLTGDLSHIEGNLGLKGETFDFSAIRKYRDTAELLNDPSVEAVDICLPTHLHYATALAALRAGKHVLVEKPLSLDGDLADELVREAQSADRVLMAAHVLRFLPAYRGLAEAMSSGKYGLARSAVFRRRCAAPVWSKWLGDAEKSGGGVFDLLIHDVDFALMMFGMPEAVSATGYEDLSLGIDVITATLQYRNAFNCVISGGWHHKKAYPFSMEYTVAADGGTFEYSSLRGDSVSVYACAGESSMLELRGDDAFEAELQYFHSCCVDGVRPNYCPPEESAAAVKIARLLLAARKDNGEKIACRI
ncbi:MAG TPA: Gfo/Idh/MocA family oxidoreductase [Bryobacteraceae bacterium]|nr:Gfo/Idh/MocA family oxidoreductase [Bryobacteraceae bacterium]